MTGARPTAVTTRRLSTGSLPVVNVVLLEIGLAAGLVLLAVSRWAALAVLLVAVPLALGRWHGRWVVRWVQLSASYLARSPGRLRIADVTSPGPAPAGENAVLGGGDPRVALLRLIVPDLIIAHGADHRREPLGLAWHQGAWTVVLQVQPPPALITPVGGTPGLPLGALTPCLADRGVVLDAIQVIWHCYPGNAALAASSPALRSYLEVLGPLPAAARRTTWVAVRLDPQRCPAAVAERGGGVLGAHRALIGALSRVRSALESRDISTRLLDADQLLRAGICAAELSAVAGTGRQVTLNEGWTAVTAAGVQHASYAISGWAVGGVAPDLTALTGVRALSTTVALALSPGPHGADAGLRGLVRVSARSHAELDAADGRLVAVSERLGVTLTALHGRHVAGLAATLPLGSDR